MKNLKKNFLVNTGLYVLNSKFLIFKINKKADMNQIIDKILKNSKEKIAVFPHMKINGLT